MSKSRGKTARRTNDFMLEAKPRKKIVVVGDWVVDEHWVTSTHRSKTRSRTGTSHHRSIQEPEGCVVTLAGAGKTTSVLYEATSYNDGMQKRYELIGMGVWNPEDESTIAHLLTPANAVGQTHHRLTYPKAPQPSDVHLFNIGGAIKTKPPCMTTRVIRIYQQKGSQYDLLDRIDWELPHSEHRELDKVILEKGLAPHLKDVDAVVIKDMAKGAVDSLLIAWLRRLFGQDKGNAEISQRPAWFVSSKKWLPSWVGKLPSGAVRLFIVPQVAADAALEHPDFSRWITGDESVTNEALSRIGELAFKFGKAMICVLPVGLQVLVRANTPEGPILFQQPVVGKGLHAVGMPMASVFLPTLVSLLLEQDTREGNSANWVFSKERSLSILSSALSFTESWMRQEVRRITEAKRWADNKQKLVFGGDGLRSPEPDAPDKDLQTEPPLLARWTDSSFEQCTREWKQAYENRGVISSDTEKFGVLEIKRAMVEVDGYVCCVQSKRQVLRSLTKEIQSFTSQGNSKAFMLQASPGAGKSYLISKLAESYGLYLLKFNITSLLSRNDLLDCFDTIVTTQAGARERKYLAFFDEINSDLEGHPVYDAFLRPLEEGLYVRAGKAFYIGPCIWIFAGTKSPHSGSEHNEGQTAKKGTDFVSRLSALPFQFDYSWRPEDEFRSDGVERLENVYAGAAILKREFPDVTHVSEAVLEVFRVIPPKTAVRKIELFVKRFNEIQYGSVTRDNLPRDWRKYMDVSAEGVRTFDENESKLRERLVRIA